MKAKGIVIAAIILIIGYAIFNRFQASRTKLYWFIPDGMRADENLITVFKWAEEGKLPNIKKMMDKGSYGYGVPVFPSHTPVNFAALMTGSYPITNGVSDGPMRIEGKSLEKPSVGGFTSAAKKVSPIWTILENAGKKVALLSMPGSTPPELKKGIVIRGRWGNWGSDDAALVFEPVERQAEMKKVGAGFRLFYFGDTLTKFVPLGKPLIEPIRSYSPVKQAVLTAHGLDIFIYMLDWTNDDKTNYDMMAVSLASNDSVVTVIPQGRWSEWFPVTLKYQDKTYNSNIKVKAIKIRENGQFRVRVLYNNLNELVTMPESVAGEMTEELGPMVDFVDNFPAQLIYEPEDKETFLEEMQMSLDYHKAAAGFVMDKYKPDIFLQDIYTPNQMLSSRWWMRYIDPKSGDYSAANSKDAMDDVLKMYQGLDAIIGEALKRDDGNTIFVLSSDHGIILQERVMALNNLFAKKGWLKFKNDPKTGEMILDWKNTKVLFLQTNNIYINPNGLEGPYKRATGSEYEALRNEVKVLLENLKDGDIKAIPQVATWEEAPKFFEISPDRIGDLIVEIAPGYGFSEAATADLTVFTDSLVSGNKQAVNPATDGMQTPFVIMGPGVKRGYRLENSVSLIDQMPTILKLLKVKIPTYVQGKIIQELITY